MDVSPTAPTVAAMVGLGVGIDYALLMLTRILEHVRAGEDFVDAAAHASTTAGRSVVLAGTTVLVSLMGLKLSGIPTLEAFGFTTAIAVVAVMFTALLLVPAVGSLFRKRLIPGPYAAVGCRSRRASAPSAGPDGSPPGQCPTCSPPRP